MFFRSSSSAFSRWRRRHFTAFILAIVSISSLSSGRKKRKYGKTAGLSCAFDKIPEFMEQGFRFFVGGADYLVIRNGYMNLREQLLKNGFTLRPVAAP